MRKTFIGIFVILVIIVIVVVTNYNKKLAKLQEIKEFNSKYENYINKRITGVDLTTVMNLSIENNIKYEIKKDSKGAFIDDKKNSIEIMVIVPEISGQPLKMEGLEKIGMKGFTENYGNSVFKAKEIKYHENGRISQMIFEIQN